MCFRILLKEFGVGRSNCIKYVNCKMVSLQKPIKQFLVHFNIAIYLVSFFYKLWRYIYCFYLSSDSFHEIR